MSRLSSTRRLSILSLGLHSVLVAIHIALLVVWFGGFENRVVFAVESEPFVSRGIKVVSTTFGTIYSALLVFVTQKLVLRRNFHKSQTLTATHDSLLAWTGLGSALVRLWQQKTIPASITGVLSALVYLANILVLHVTFPGLLALDSVFLNTSVSVTTQGLPVSISQSDRLNAMSSAGQYAMGSLASLPFLSMDDTVGLHRGTLYDVWLNNTAATGLASVNATGFNVSCGYLPIAPFGFEFPCPCFNLNGTKYSLGLTDPNLVAPLHYTVEDSINVTYYDSLVFPAPSIFYSPIPILDSNNQTGTWVNLSSSIGVREIQLFRCSVSLVQQTAILNSTTREIVLVEPVINRTTSTWQPFDGGSPDFSDIAFAYPQGFLDIRTIYLHELENQLANLVASMFWTLGHVPPLPGYNPSNSTTNSSPLNVSLLAGNARVEEMILQVRLNDHRRSIDLYGTHVSHTPISNLCQNHPLRCTT
ncbi:hypothetical protein K438DRAFT_1945748 [Mycena galopus ATCC 62051]|nr:hypothetical protein K438DRAFT_1945748 [Mycena galopus ATCC 62051]